jgi:hypothetical protein
VTRTVRGAPTDPGGEPGPVPQSGDNGDGQNAPKQAISGHASQHTAVCHMGMTPGGPFDYDRRHAVQGRGRQYLDK